MGHLDIDNFFANSLEMLCIADDKGYFKKLNPRWAEVLGYSLEELMSKPFIEFVHPDDREDTLKEAQELNHSKTKTITFENRYRKKDGHYCWLAWNATSLDGFVYAVAREVSNMKIQQSFFEEMQKAAKIGGWRLKLDTMTPMWSDATYDLHEVERGSPVDIENAIHFYAPEARPVITKYVEDCIHKAQAYDVELPFITAKGKKLWVRVIGKPIINEGKVTELYGVFQDITEKRNNESQLFNASKLASLGEMAGGIAHEINNPLAIISATTSKLRIMLKEPERYTEEITKTLETLEKTTKRISNIISGLKAFARDSKNESYEASNIENIIDSTLALCFEKFKSNGVQVKVENLCPQQKIFCNQVQISQILLNLLNNAYDAIADSKEKNISLKADISENYVEIKVSDSGPGVPLEVQEKIFEPFFTTKPVGTGTGLGLGISHEIARLHKGKLSLQTDSAETTFVLSLPIERRGAKAA